MSVRDIAESIKVLFMPSNAPDDEPRFAPPDLADGGRTQRREAVELPAAALAKLRTTQIIHAALVVGVGVFLVLVAVLQSGGSIQGNASLVTLGWMLPLGLGAAALTAAPAVRRVALAAARAQPAQAVERFVQTSILLGAILEGPALLAAVMGLLSGSGLPLAVGAALVVAMALQFPSKAKAVEFLSG